MSRRANSKYSKPWIVWVSLFFAGLSLVSTACIRRIEVIEAKDYPKFLFPIEDGKSTKDEIHQRLIQLESTYIDFPADELRVGTSIDL
jgi:hypothetical protein